jgi:hypothetical protein
MFNKKIVYWNRTADGKIGHNFDLNGESGL